MRASLFRRSPLLVLVVALAALAVLLVHDSRPASADHGNTVWSATLSPSDLSNFSGTGFGCQDGFLGCLQVLTGSNTFTYNGTSHTIDTIKVDGGVLTFATDLGQSGLRELTLNVDGTAFPLADAASNQWSNTGLDWSARGSVELSLTGSALPYGAVLSTESLNVTEGGSGTFTVALTSDPGADKTVQLVTTQFFQSAGEPGHVWDKNAVTVLPVTMTFTAGSSGNWATPQTVTVRAPGDADVTNEQLIIHVFEQKSSYGYVQCIGAGDYDYDGVTHVYHGNGDGDYCSAQLFDHGPVGGVYNAVNGVHVTVTDSGVNFVIEPPTNVQAHAGEARLPNTDGTADPGRWLARFSWEAPGGSQTVTGYDFQWRREGGSWPVGLTSLSASDTSLIIRPSLGDNVNQSRGTVLGYRVRTRTADGASPWIEGTLTLDNPANLVRNLYVLTGNAGELGLAWTAPADWLATDYEVHYREPTGGWTGMSSDPAFGWVDAGYTGGTDQLMTIPNLKDGTEYRVRVRAKSDWDFAWTVGTGTSGGTAPAIGGSGGTGGAPGVVHNPNPGNRYAGLIADVKLWRDDPCCAHNPAHTERWDRVLLALGESVADASLQPMTAAEAQGFADRGWTRWTGVAEALRELEAAENDPVPPAVGSDPGDSSGDSPGSPGDAPDEGPGAGPEPANPANQAPTVSATLADVSGLEAGATREVSLAGVFHDPDGDALTITGGPDDDAIVTVEVASDGSGLTLTGVSEGTAIVLVFAEDPSGESVFTEFNVTVVKAPEPETEGLSEIAARYDADSNGKIDVSEYRRALNDYIGSKIGYSELLEVVVAYQAS